MDMEFAILLPTLCIILLADAQIFQNQTGIPITQELSGPLADECVSFTRLLGRIKASFAFQSFTNVSDLDCQDKCIAAGSCQSFSFGITTAGVTECLLSVYNRKSQPALFDDNGLIQNFNYYEKSREGCMECEYRKILLALVRIFGEPLTCYSGLRMWAGPYCSARSINRTFFRFGLP